MPAYSREHIQKIPFINNDLTAERYRKLNTDYINTIFTPNFNHFLY